MHKRDLYLHSVVYNVQYSFSLNFSLFLSRFNCNAQSQRKQQQLKFLTDSLFVVLPLWRHIAKFVRKRVPLIYSPDRGFHGVKDFFPSALNISFYEKGLEGSKRAENGPNYTLPPHLQTKFSAKKVFAV